jgi:excisionase family DNA binding protein
MTKEKEKLLSVTQVAEMGEISRQRVLQLIRKGLLKVERVGDIYAIRQKDFDAWSGARRKAGRPPTKTKKPIREGR